MALQALHTHQTHVCKAYYSMVLYAAQLHACMQLQK